MKSAIWVFRSISWLEKTVSSVVIKINPEEDRLKIKLHCKFSVTKIFTINFLECESLQAHYDTSSSANHFTTDPHLLNEAALNFLTNQEEVTMTASTDSFKMNNYVDSVDEETDRNAVHTNLTLQPTEFEVYSIGQTTSVTFCLKELRSLISFADAFLIPVSVDFDVGGK